MITALDSNILIALWNRNDAMNSLAQPALDAALERGRIVMSAPVFAELLAGPAGRAEFLDHFCERTRIFIDWDLSEVIWRDAGLAFQKYAHQRRLQREAGPRRILADFLIGAHAMHKASQLLTLDSRIYRAAFPNLSVVAI